MHRAPRRLVVLLVVALVAVACTADVSAPRLSAPSRALLASGGPWGPETPPFNLEAILRAPDGQQGFGLVKFRQPNDNLEVVNLDVWVRDLAANSSYSLQRATDQTIDGACTGTNWLTLGQGSVPQSIITDDRGTGRAALFRVLTSPLGATFDIHFRVIESGTNPPNVVLSSGCYEFRVSL